MNRDDIIRMALESGFGCDTDGHIFTYNQDGICDEYLERFADLVAALEREACAKVCDTLPMYGPNEETADWYGLALVDCAAAIRARSST